MVVDGDAAVNDDTGVDEANENPPPDDDRFDGLA